ncbi:dTDP-4-dehydrorhamnose reductase [Qipengyuania sp.]|uniref:dTDP-4-dehydrorhamnose reductase n=1 Tax=Qipengyuania sp. TaxID=2004515 RepID=UPI003AF44C37
MILVFGQTGQVACELQELAPEAQFLGRADADLSDPAGCARVIADYRPEVVINAAAYTAVDRAEEEVELATVVNGDAPGAMAEACARLSIPLVHISTDYVFDGTGDDARKPSDPVAPVNSYGRTKELGERRIREAGATHAILRTSWVFSPYGSNFVRTMVRLGGEREDLRIVADQVGGPTPAKAIAEACLAMAGKLVENRECSGTYHFAGEPDVSWADFAREIFRLSNMDVRVHDIATHEFPTPATRPANSRLDCSDIAVLGIARPDWRTSLKETLDLMEKS